ncbi:Protein of unknown function [Nakamurella panacisegetis]|uniref:DUF2771 domain-containing protein n=1 Tax=Nakamurella panacisegetis TaxID=1090615 RepID=A0A1H0J4F5_9ACTN|nr:DUF2771 family protein [Nakamurella panacisegetis]SDO38586.1 Protein of unknown function [Nakamurella panacisegetis]
MTRFRPARLGGLLAAAALLVAGCTSPRPEVTFYGNRTAVQVEAYGWCKDLTTCTLDKARIARLTMHADQALQVNVPSEIGDSIWRVIWTFQDTKTKVVTSGSSPYFTDKRLSFTVPSFGTAQILQTVEVQRLIAGTDANGNVGFAVTSSWDLLIVPSTSTAAS